MIFPIDYRKSEELRNYQKIITGKHNTHYWKTHYAGLYTILHYQKKIMTTYEMTFVIG